MVSVDFACLETLGGLEEGDPFAALRTPTGLIRGHHPLRGAHAAGAPEGSRILVPQSLHALSVVLARHMTRALVPVWASVMFRRCVCAWGFGAALCWNHPEDQDGLPVPGLRGVSDGRVALAEVFTWEARLLRAARSRGEVEQLRSELSHANDMETALSGLEQERQQRPWTVEGL